MMIFADFQAGYLRRKEKSEKVKLISRNHRECKKIPTNKAKPATIIFITAGHQNPTEIEDL